jgi:hypothetical protein
MGRTDKFCVSWHQFVLDRNEVSSGRLGCSVGFCWVYSGIVYLEIGFIYLVFTDRKFVAPAIALSLFPSKYTSRSSLESYTYASVLA